MEGKFFETREEVVMVMRDFQPLFSYFVGEVCGGCKKTANVPPVAGWFCRCGHYNIQCWNGSGMMPHEAPAYGPPASLIRDVGQEVNTIHVVGYSEGPDSHLEVFVGGEREDEARRQAERHFALAEELPGGRVTPFWFAVCDPYLRRLYWEKLMTEIDKIMEPGIIPPP